MSADELRVKIKDLSKDLVIARMKVNQKVLKDTSSIRKIRRDIARARTFLNNKKRENA
ncbi:MAG: 50S ribosomal protein L29 [Elusimicrobia bacterium]|nr:50S ribosomal protein L29 [Elusimicrobiota bacterium]